MSDSLDRDAATPTGAAYQPLVALAAAFMVGIVVDRYWPLRTELWWLAAAAALGLWGAAWRIRANKTAACLLLAAVAALGAARHHRHWSVFDWKDLGRAADAAPRPVCLEAVALESPRWRPAPPPSPLVTFPRGDQMQLDVRIVRVRDENCWRSATGKARLLVEGHLLQVRAGDRLRVVGHVQRIQPPLNPGEFDFAANQRAERKLCRVAVEHPDGVTVVARGSPWRFRRWVCEARNYGDEVLWRRVGDERAALASALVLGLREQLDRQKVEAFFVTGTVHILAISGLNVGILAGAFWAIARLGVAPRKVALLAAIVLVAFYAVLTNAEPPVVRAAILVAAFCVGRLLGRPLFVFNSLAAAALAVLAINPAELFDTGAQLSFLAVGTLTLVGQYVQGWRSPPTDPLDRLIVQTRPWPQRALRAVKIRLAQSLTASAAVWLAVLPLTMYVFHIVSPEAIALNLLIAVPVTMALLTGFGVLVCEPLFPPLAAFFGGVCDWSLAFMEWTIEATQSALPIHFWTPGPAAWWVIGCYAALAAWASLPRFRPPRRWLAALSVGWMVVGLAPPDHGFPPIAEKSRERSGESREPEKHLVLALDAPLSSLDSSDSQLACTFISVGHGVSVLVEFPDGRTLLYDAGGMGPPTSSAQSIAGVLWSRGLRHVDAVAISHADADHYNALPELLKRFSVGTVYVSPVMFENDSAALTMLREAIDRAGVPLQVISLGDRLAVGEEALAEVLHPPPRGALGNDNANSLVLHLEAFGRRALLTGDLEGVPLESLLEEEPTAYDLVLAPHHGSRRSNPPGFAAWAAPGVAVISGSQRDISEEVTYAFQSAAARVFHTAKDGAVRVTLRRHGVYVQTWRGEGD